MRLKNSSWIIVLFFLSLALFSWLESSYTFIDPDSFYHARAAQLISRQGIIADFPWQQISVLKDNFADHHLLYHLFIALFNYFFNPVIAVKIGSVLLNALFVLIFSWYLCRKNVRYFWAYPIILLTVAPFLIRLGAPKASPLALILFLAGIYFLERKKYLYLFLVSFLYVWSHGGFVLLLVAGIIFWNKKNILAIISGLASGLIINPYFPQNLAFYWQQLVQIGIINYKGRFEVGAEWYHFYPQDLVGSSYIIWIPFILAAVIFIIYFKRQNTNNKQWAVLFVFFLLATIRSRRFVEYLVPASLIWSAIVLSWYLKSDFFPAHFRSFLGSWRKKKIWWSLFFAYLLLALTFGAARGLYNVYNQQCRGISVFTFRNASWYLSNKSSPGDIVFNAGWDEWPLLFFHNQKNYYLVGLDPTFMYNYDRNLFKLWQDLGAGKITKETGQVIKNNFRARYVFINKKNKDNMLLNAFLARDKKVEKIYEDSESYIYEIN